MSTTLYLIQAQQLLELALEQARQERDCGVFELARGERSLQHLQRLVERVALVQGLWQRSAACSAPRSSPRHRRGSGQVSTGGAQMVSIESNPARSSRAAYGLSR